MIHTCKIQVNPLPAQDISSSSCDATREGTANRTADPVSCHMRQGRLSSTSLVGHGNHASFSAHGHVRSFLVNRQTRRTFVENNFRYFGDYEEEDEPTCQ